VTMATDPSRTRAESGLLGQIVVVIGGSSGIGLETARQARAAGAQVVLTARTEERLDSVGPVKAPNVNIMSSIIRYALARTTRSFGTRHSADFGYEGRLCIVRASAIQRDDDHSLACARCRRSGEPRRSSRSSPSVRPSQGDGPQPLLDLARSRARPPLLDVSYRYGLLEQPVVASSLF
jgi:short chain dehydrogenase